jgi:hypothetical protein
MGYIAVIVIPTLPFLSLFLASFLSSHPYPHTISVTVFSSLFHLLYYLCLAIFLLYIRTFPLLLVTSLRKSLSHFLSLLIVHTFHSLPLSPLSFQTVHIPFYHFSPISFLSPLSVHTLIFSLNTLILFCFLALPALFYS